MRKTHRTSKRDKLKKSAQKTQDSDITTLFDDILSADMDYEPDYDTDLSLKSIRDDSAVEYWFQSLSDNSQNSYTKALEQYCYCRQAPKAHLSFFCFSLSLKYAPQVSTKGHVGFSSCSNHSYDLHVPLLKSMAS